jgi:hypothetical protein
MAEVYHKGAKKKNQYGKLRSGGIFAIVCRLTRFFRAAKMITDYRLQITDYRLQITDYRLQITDYRLQITDYLSIIFQHKISIHTNHIKNSRHVSFAFFGARNVPFYF